MATSGANSQKEDVFKPSQTPPKSETTESHGHKQDLTAESDVKAPGVVQRTAEEVQAVAGEALAAITPGSKK